MVAGNNLIVPGLPSSGAPSSGFTAISFSGIENEEIIIGRQQCLKLSNRPE
jgi:hypothetical protein